MSEAKIIAPIDALVAKDSAGGLSFIRVNTDGALLVNIDSEESKKCSYCGTRHSEDNCKNCGANEWLNHKHAREIWHKGDTYGQKHGGIWVVETIDEENQVVNVRAVEDTFEGRHNGFG